MMTDSGFHDGDRAAIKSAHRVHVDRSFCPSAEDMRMVRTIALLSLLEAARHGTYRARFRRFQVEAWRESAVGGASARVQLHLCVSLGGCVLEQTAVPACQMSEQDVPLRHPGL